MKTIFGFPGLLSISNASHLCQVQIFAVEVNDDNLEQVILHLRANNMQYDLLSDFPVYSMNFPITEAESSSSLDADAKAPKPGFVEVEHVVSATLQNSLLGMPQLLIENVQQIKDLYRVISLRFELAKREASMDWTVLVTPDMLSA